MSDDDLAETAARVSRKVSRDTRFSAAELYEVAKALGGQAAEMEAELRAICSIAVARNSSPAEVSRLMGRDKPGSGS